MTKARDLADLGGVTTRLDQVGNTDGALSNRNMIINGGFAVSQRGNYSSATTAVSGSYFLDRWKIALSAVTGSVQHNEVVLPNGTTTMAMKVAATASHATGYVGARHVIEDFRALSGQTVTASMWVRTTLSSMTFRHDSTANFGDFVNPDGQWHYHTATYQMPTITSAGTGANQTTLALINYTGSEGGGTTSGDYFEVAQVQLEVGDTATPFEHRSYGDELARCQRFYEILSNTGGNSTPASYSSVGGGRFYCTPMTYAVTKRTTPTATIDGGSAYWTIPGVAGYGAIGTKSWGTIGLDTTAVTPYAVHVSGYSAPSNAYVYRWESSLEVILDAEL